MTLSGSRDSRGLAGRVRKASLAVAYHKHRPAVSPVVVAFFTSRLRFRSAERERSSRSGMPSRSGWSLWAFRQCSISWGLMALSPPGSRIWAPMLIFSAAGLFLLSASEPERVAELRSCGVAELSVAFTIHVTPHLPLARYSISSINHSHATPL